MYVLFGIVFIVLPFLTSLYNDKAVVATQAIDEEPFSKSIIYVYNHDFMGANGLFLNKPLTSKQRAEIPEEIRHIRHFYYGGVLDFPDAITVAEINSDGSGVDLKIRSLKSALEDNPDIIDRIKQQGAAGHIRLYAGYLGWDSFQLDQEVFVKNAWSGIHLDRDLIYTADPYEMWSKAVNHSKHKWATSGI